MDIKQKLKTLWIVIHRGEEIVFDYRLKSGKVIVGRTTKPIDIDRRMTLYGLDHWNGLMGVENCYKVRFMENIERRNTKEGYITDQYDPERSTLKYKVPVTYR